MSWSPNHCSLDDVCSDSFMPESRLKTCVWKVGIWDCACISLTRPIIILMSPASSGTIEGQKCANINMPLKERWLGVHRTQVLLTQSWSRSNSPSPLGSPLFISHMARPPVLLTQDTGRDAEKSIWGHEHGTSMGKIILKVPSWQWRKAHPG